MRTECRERALYCEQAAGLAMLSLLHGWLGWIVSLIENGVVFKTPGWMK